jgi:colicin import membrane protein
MPAAADRLEFAPPPQPGTVRAFVLAILAHVVLMIALTWGISWNRESENTMAEAELWSSVPKQAAPAGPPVVNAPSVVQAPPIQAAPAPPPPAPKVEPPAPEPKAPDIALEQEKRKQEQAERRQEELERQKKIEARRKQEELEKRELAEKKAVEEKKRQEELAKAAKAKAREQEQAKQLAAIRQENLDRMKGLAGATGRPDSAGTAQRSSGPSDSYAGRVQARVRPHIVFTDDVSGNPKAEVEVRMAPDGTITSRRLVKSSGVRSWDEAVLRALDRTEVLPRDVDGRIHTPLTIEFRPRS